MSKTVTLEHAKSISFKGHVLINCIKGSLEILGYNIKCNSNWYPVSSPESSSLCTITALEDSEFVVKENQDGLVNIETLDNSFKGLYSAPSFFHTSDSLPSIKYNQSWIDAQNTLRNYSKSPIALISGNRKIGKSTFCRFLVNSLLNAYPKVIFVDLDVGQTEFTPPGILSLCIVDRPLLGPPFTHTALPEHAEFMGTNSPGERPKKYVDHCIAIKENLNKYPDIPVVINTMGWISGLGLKLLHSILYIFNPSHILPLGDSEYVDSLINSPPKGFINDHTSLQSAILKAEIPEIAPSSGKYNPRVQRSLSLLSYFLCTSQLESKWFSEYKAQNLCDLVPYKVPIGKVMIRFLFDKIPKKESLLALNSSIVGLVVSEPFSGQGNPPFLDAEARGEFLGLGIVRAIDSDFFYILTPVPIEKLSKVNCFFKGNLDLPTNLILGNGDTPYTSFLHNSTLSQTRKTRHNLKRNNK